MSKRGPLKKRVTRLSVARNFRQAPAGIKIKSKYVLLHFPRRYDMDNGWFATLLRIIERQADRRPRLYDAPVGLKWFITDLRKYRQVWDILGNDMGIYFGTRQANGAFLKCLRKLRTEIEDPRNPLLEESIDLTNFTIPISTIRVVIIYYLGEWIKLHEAYASFLGVRCFKSAE